MLKFNGDLIFLLLLLAHLRLEPDIHLNNRWNQESEIGSVYLGNTAAYTQISHHAIYSGTRYPHPKSLEYNEVDEATSLFSRLNFYDTLRARRPSLITCVADSEDKSKDGDSCNNDSPGTGFAERPSNERENTLRFDGHELTAEVSHISLSHIIAKT